MAKPINKALLVHTCTLKKPTGTDRDRNTVYSETVLKNVRIGVALQNVRGNIGEVKADSMSLYIDAVNTVYETAEGEEIPQALPAENDLIVWENISFTVRKIMPCYARSTDPHHWEVELE